jgi:hypothetical protein
VKNMMLLLAATGLCLISFSRSTADAHQLQRPIHLRQTAGPPAQARRAELDSIDLLGRQEAAPVRLIYDRAHGEEPLPGPMDAIAKKLGLEIQTFTLPINAEALKGFRLL